MKIEDRELRNRRIVSTLIYSVIQMMSLITPFVMGKIIDEYIPKRMIFRIVFGIILFVTIPFISVGLKTIYNYYTIKFIRKKGNEYAIKIMENLMYKEMAYFDRENSLELLSYASKEIVGYVNFEVEELSQYYVNIIMSAAIFMILFSISPVLALMQLLYIPAAKYPVKKISKSVEKEIKTVVSKNAENNQIKGDIFKAIDFIKLNRLEKAKLNEVEKNNDKINDVWGRVAAFDSLSGIWTAGFATVLFSGVTFGIGAIFILTGGKLLIGQLVSIITYCGLLYSCLNTIMQTDISKAKNDSEYEKVFSYLDMAGEREKNKGKQPFVMNKGIYCKNLCFSYPGKEEILSNVNFSFEKGKWTGIVGPSGSGKSTLLGLITGLYDVNDNELYIDSVDINKIDRFDLRERVTKISQDIFLFPGTIEDNLKLIAPEASDADVAWALDMACLTDFIGSLPCGIKTDVGEAGKLISGGERQRLAIAAGLLRKTKILLLDEVSSSLDPYTEERLAENFHKLSESGYTIISVSHKREFLKYADKLIDFASPDYEGYALA